MRAKLLAILSYRIYALTAPQMSDQVCRAERRIITVALEPRIA
jgi:hypothetical protein